MTAESNPAEITIIRIYDAPIEAVWDAWTDPQQVAQWWGPRGFTLTTHSKDLRPGGTWVYTMHGPDGTDYPNKTHYFEVEKYSKLVYDHGGSDDRPPMFRVTVLFSRIKGKTRMQMTMSLPTAQAAAETRAFIKKAGGNGTWDRLAEYLEKQSTGKEVFVIARAFDAPIDVMYEMWRDPEHLAQWLPPTGFAMQFIRTDVAPGKSSFYCMSGAGNMKMFGRVEYLEFNPPTRIVYTQQFCDEHEKPVRHPMSPTWPETMLTVVTLAEESAGRTRVTVTWQPHGPTTPQELETFIKARGGMTQGWTGSFDKLEAYVKRPH
jgi:uncharacterized protein YndB with AHSA1/START domain